MANQYDSIERENLGRSRPVDTIRSIRLFGLRWSAPLDQIRQHEGESDADWNQAPPRVSSFARAPECRRHGQPDQEPHQAAPQIDGRADVALLEIAEELRWERGHIDAFLDRRHA